jgi:glycogen debranching enzyme
LVGRIERSDRGAPLRNPAFDVGSVGFSALVAWNAVELATVTADDELRRAGEELADAVDARWSEDLATWVDSGVGETGSGRVRTLDSLLPLLVASRPDAWRDLADPFAFAAPCGPRGVHLAEPCYEPHTYWRGSAWPQLTYLLWLAATRSPSGPAAASLSRSMVAGAVTSGFAEHWVPESGRALGAVPQSWTTLVAVVASA